MEISKIGDIQWLDFVGRLSNQEVLSATLKDSKKKLKEKFAPLPKFIRKPLVAAEFAYKKSCFLAYYTPKSLRQRLALLHDEARRQAVITAYPTPPPPIEITPITDERWFKIVDRLHLDEETKIKLRLVSDDPTRQGIAQFHDRVIPQTKKAQVQEFKAYFKQLYQLQQNNLISPGLSMFLTIISYWNSAGSLLSGNFADAVGWGAQGLFFNFLHNSSAKRQLQMNQGYLETKKAIKQGIDLSKSSIQGEKPKDWTVLFYIGGANNLHPIATSALENLQKVGSDEHVNLVAQMSTYGTKRGVIREKKGKDGKYPFVSEHLGMQDMADSKTFKEALLWTIKKFPSKRLAVVMWNHGAGMLGSMRDDYSRWEMRNKELAKAAEEVYQETGKKIDLLNFNACLMAGIEGKYDLRNATDYIVASQEVQAGTLLPFTFLNGTTPQHKVMEDLKRGIQERGEITPEELGKLYVYETKNQFGAQTFSPTIEFSKTTNVKPLAAAVQDLRICLMEAMKNNADLKPVLQEIIRKTQHYLNLDMKLQPYSDYRDLGDFAQRIAHSKKISDPKIKVRALAVLSKIPDVVIKEHHVDENLSRKLFVNSHGISIWLPEKYSENNTSEFSRRFVYDSLDFAQDTGWHEFLKAVSAVSNDKKNVKKQGRTWSLFRQSISQLTQILPYNLVPELGMEKPSIPLFFALLGPFGAYPRLKKAINKFATIHNSPLPFFKKSKLYAGAVLDTALGVASAALPAGYFFPEITPVLLATFAVGAGRVAIGAGKGLIRSQLAARKSIEEKLKAS